MEDTLKFINDVIAQYNERMKSQPYQINLLEEVHMHDEDGSEEQLRMKENAHSRILRSILAFRSKGDPVLLKSLIEYIVSLRPDSHWGEIEINHPEEPRTEDLTEDGRIDLFIEEPNHFAIIFENKINEVGDQPNQLARYIKYERKRGYEERQIYVVYLSSDGHEPSEQSWTDPETGSCYKESYQTRYVNLPYKNAILPWIKYRAIPTIKNIDGEQLLESALYQYVNYLEIKYQQRNIDLMKNADLKKALGFKEGQPVDEIITEARTKLDSVLEVKKGITDLIKELLHSKYPNLHVVEDNQYNFKRSNVDAAFSFSYNNSTFYVALYKYDGGNSLYCGVFATKKGTIPNDLRAHFNYLKSDRKNGLYCNKPLSGYSDKTIDKVLSTANSIASQQ